MAATAEKKRRGMRLRGKFTIGLLILGAALMAAILTLTYVFYRNASLEKYRHIVASAVQMAARLVDGDDAERYLGTLEPDDAYYATESLLQGVLDYHGLTYLYVYIPRWEDGYCEFVFDVAQRPEGGAAPEPGNSAIGSRMEILGPEEDSSIAIVRQVTDTLRPNLELNLSVSQFGSLASAFCPLFDGRGELAAVVGADVDVRHVLGEINRFMLIIGSIIAALIALAVFVFRQYFARTMIRPLQELAAHAQGFAGRRNEQGRLYPDPIRISTRDEIEDLADAFNQTARDIIQYVDDVTSLTRERQRAEAELGVAARIQASVLSHDFCIAPAPGAFSLCAMMEPAKEVGGDFYDFLMLDDRRLALIVGDVSGKGVPAALFMMMAKSIIRAQLGRGGQLGLAFAEANSLICQNNGEDMFVTVLCVLLDTDTGELAIADAGHGPPVLIGADGACGKIETKPSLFMGAMDGVAYSVAGGRMSPGDRLLLYTDGVNEAGDAGGRFFGNDGLLASIKAHAGGGGANGGTVGEGGGGVTNGDVANGGRANDDGANGGRANGDGANGSAVGEGGGVVDGDWAKGDGGRVARGNGELGALLDGIRADIRAFAGCAPQSDDITMLAVQWRGADAGEAGAEGAGGAAAGVESEVGVESGIGGASASRAADARAEFGERGGRAGSAPEGVADA
jgi:sigma-B regulation protein RsbU (phosphoserine phosphatase)